MLHFHRQARREPGDNRVQVVFRHCQRFVRVFPGFQKPSRTLTQHFLVGEQQRSVKDQLFFHLFLGRFGHGSAHLSVNADLHRHGIGNADHDPAGEVVACRRGRHRAVVH